jgi:CheY-like chemotaxis protein
MRFLIIDDIYTNRLRIAVILKSMGFAFDEAADGEKAIEKILQMDYDIVLMDIEMPVKNGLETIQFIRSKMTGRKKKVPVVAVTAHNISDNIDRYLEIGFDALISKPVTEQKLITVLRALIT